MPLLGLVGALIWFATRTNLFALGDWVAAVVLGVSVMALVGAALVSRGVKISGPLPPDLELRLARAQPGLVLLSSRTLRPFDLHLIQSLVFSLFGRDAEAQVVELREASPALLRLAGPREQLSAIGQVLYERRWERSDGLVDPRYRRALSLMVDRLLRVEAHQVSRDGTLWRREWPIQPDPRAQLENLLREIYDPAELSLWLVKQLGPAAAEVASLSEALKRLEPHLTEPFFERLIDEQPWWENDLRAVARIWIQRVAPPLEDGQLEQPGRRSPQQRLACGPPPSTADLIDMDQRLTLPSLDDEPA